MTLKKHILGRCLVAGAIIAILAGVILFTVDVKDLAAWFTRYRQIIVWTTVLIAGALAYVLPRRRQIQLTVQQASRKQGIEPPVPADKVTQEAEQSATRAVGWAKDLRFQLQQSRRFRWAYTHTWLLVTGDAPTVRRLLPGVAERGWLITDDVVLLWGGAGTDGQPDELWLRQIRRLRRARPIDAMVLALDGATPLPETARSTTGWAMNLVCIMNTLQWSAPVYVLDQAELSARALNTTPVIGCELPNAADAHAIGTALGGLNIRLTNLGIAQIGRDDSDRYTGLMSDYLDSRIAALSNWIAGVNSRLCRAVGVRGVFFTTHPPVGNKELDAALWHHLATDALRTGGHRIGLHPVTVFSTIAFGAVALWTTGLLLSAATNAHDVVLTSEAVRNLNAAQDSAARLRNLLGLQQRISLYEDRIQHHTPLQTRFGLNHDAQTLSAVWKPYSRAARDTLIAPVQQNLEAQLVDLNQMQTTQLDNQTSQLAQDGHKALKTYLMMSEPAHADPSFMTPLLPHYWDMAADLPPGEKLDLSQRLLGFYADHLKQHPEWRIDARDDLISGSRQTLLAVIGVKNSEDTIYQDIVASVGRKYPDQTLASLTAGTDTRGLFRTSASVPGVFTREAWEGTIAQAIDDAAKHNGTASDWVLAGANTTNSAQQTQTASSPEALKAALTSHYFADYAEHWQAFMNTIQWENAPSMPAAIGQLKAMVDARQSPLIALMKSLEYQGGAGAQKTSLSDTLVTKAQTIFGGSKADEPQAVRPDPAGPLGPSFGPVLRLVAQANGSDVPSASSKTAASYSDLSLQRYLERVTTLRLRLQQIGDSADADAQARQVAQTLFQGKGSELADTQSYARLIAASLGAQWAGTGDALFVRSVAQALQTVLQPAQASLNEAWQQSIVSAWNRSFAGRYPFASTANDASLPELARFLRPQGGLISAFLASQLAGVLELQGDQWIPVTTATSSLVFDPSFLTAINTLQRIAGHLLAQGEPQYRVEFKPVPSPGITDTLLTVDGQKLHYFNQQETWQPMNWPSNDPQRTGTRLEWQTEKAGTNRSLEFDGRWAFVRMLERARVEPVDSATYMLTWQASPFVREIRPTAAKSASDAAYDIDTLIAQEPGKPALGSDTHALGYMMRTDVGKGPLELLALKGFVLPSRIFVSRSPGAANLAKDNGPPPLPKAALEAGKRAATPMPQS
ncbi:type VI secretion system protein ImpL [Paraburkholderia hospita]|uniref:ImcF-related family protein n=1 Tax=Paraburkholderia hospita TaxID=169430 RepID=UPI0008A8148C|nr:ImcF-related family protein [Paraburkholderia hospita]SEH48776.1 type VI secretion system protein ImpL [Paraburkholderia hospita]